MATDERLEAVARAGRHGGDRIAREVSLDIEREPPCGFVPPRAFLLHRLHHDPVELAPHHRLELGRLNAPAGCNGGERRAALAQARAGSGRINLADDALHLAIRGEAELVAQEWGRARDEFVQHHAQGINVGAGVDVRGALGLLGAHVFGRADQAAMLGEEGFLGEARVGGLGDAKVDDLDAGLAVYFTDEHVAGLDVAVDDALRVGVLHGGADLGEQFEPLAQTDVAFVAIAHDWLALDQFHHEERPPHFRRPCVQYLGDVRVVHHR